MQPFTRLNAIAAPMPLSNIDTDMIIPKQFLRTIARTGLGKALFHEMRTLPDGSDKPDFVLNKKPWDKAQILVSGENFGCGSSREHAPWALLDFGIRSILAPSFADIFYNNCFKNGILPIALPRGQINALMSVAEKGAPIEIDLEKQEIRADGLSPLSFDIDPFRRRCLLGGLDDIGLTLEKSEEIARYESENKHQHPWLWSSGT